MDNILIATSESLEYHCQQVNNVLKKLLTNDLFLNLKKCQFHIREVEFLGAIVGKGEVKMDPIKVKAIEEWPMSTDLHFLCSFLGFGNYYKDFIEDYSKLTRPLHNLTKKGTPWHWGDSQHIAFETLKEKFTSYLVLRNPDPHKCYILDTDASLYAVGTTLSQDFHDGWHPITYFSNSLLPVECNYDIYDRELLAIIFAIKAFCHLLLGVHYKFLIRFNHENLKYFKSPQKISAHQARWHVFLQDYDFKLVHFPEKSNTIADLLSRRKDFEGGVNPNQSITLLPEKLFVCKVYLEDNDDKSLRSKRQWQQHGVAWPKERRRWPRALRFHLLKDHVLSRFSRCP